MPLESKRVFPGFFRLSADNREATGRPILRTVFAEETMVSIEFLVEIKDTIEIPGRHLRQLLSLYFSKATLNKSTTSGAETLQSNEATDPCRSS